MGSRNFAQVPPQGAFTFTYDGSPQYPQQSPYDEHCEQFGQALEHIYPGSVLHPSVEDEAWDDVKQEAELEDDEEVSEEDDEEVDGPGDSWRSTNTRYPTTGNLAEHKDREQAHFEEDHGGVHSPDTRQFAATCAFCAAFQAPLYQPISKYRVNNNPIKVIDNGDNAPSNEKKKKHNTQAARRTRARREGRMIALEATNVKESWLNYWRMSNLARIAVPMPTGAEFDQVL